MDDISNYKLEKDMKLRFDKQHEEMRKMEKHLDFKFDKIEKQIAMVGQNFGQLETMILRVMEQKQEGEIGEKSPQKELHKR